MTILSCQKRKHEPHVLWVTHLGAEVILPTRCNGDPQWPYARPKPPRIRDVAGFGYDKRHDRITVFKGIYCGGWFVETPGSIDSFPTHPEAIVYAQNLVNERRKQNGS